ncbi:MAG TPA: hypothetical protein VHR42_01890 [Clostridia bacterium]|nr:hypothetical protein [Clostridia bacterium]
MRKRNRDENSTLRKRLITAATVLCAAVFLISAGALVYQLVILPAQSDNIVNDARSLYRKDVSSSNAPSSIPSKQVKAASLAELQKINPDVQGWITVPNSVIDYPVLCYPKKR